MGLCAVANPELVARIAEEGHDIGNHTWSHPYLPDLTRDEVLRQVDATGEVLGGVAGTAPGDDAPALRLAYPRGLALARRPRSDDGARGRRRPGLDHPGADAIVATVTTAAAPGSIVLMHDAGGDRTQTVASAASRSARSRRSPD